MDARRFLTLRFLSAAFHLEEVRPIYRGQDPEVRRGLARLEFARRSWFWPFFLTLVVWFVAVLAAACVADLPSLCFLWIAGPLVACLLSRIVVARRGRRDRSGAGGARAR